MVVPGTGIDGWEHVWEGPPPRVSRDRSEGVWDRSEGHQDRSQGPWIYPITYPFTDPSPDHTDTDPPLSHTSHRRSRLYAILIFAVNAP